MYLCVIVPTSSRVTEPSLTRLFQIQIIRGFVYHCRTCYDTDFCYKCYGRKEQIHEPHEWEKLRQEFMDYESSWSDEDEDSDDEATKHNRKPWNDSSSDSSSSSDDS